jgi:hypothetical protein
VPVGA